MEQHFEPTNLDAPNAGLVFQLGDYRVNFLGALSFELRPLIYLALVGSDYCVLGAALVNVLFKNVDVYEFR